MVEPGDNEQNLPLDRWLLVDGHAYAYRAFHAIRQLTAPNGTATNAIYGFIKMLEKMIGLIRPTHLHVAWDGGLAPERVAAHPAYKAQRPPMSESLDQQITEIQRYLTAQRFSFFCQAGVEADDWIATVAHRVVGQGGRVVIASADKDFMQLVQDAVGLFNPNDKTESVWTADKVREKTGVNPLQVVDWLSLVGDAVDNIPGAPGVGPKTATELLTRFGDLPTLLGNLGAVESQRIRGSLETSREALLRNQELIRLKPDLPYALDLAACQIMAPDVPSLGSLYAQWGFRGMLAAVAEPKLQQGSLF